MTDPTLYPSAEEREMIRESVRSLATDLWPLEKFEQACERGNDSDKFRELNHRLAEQGSLMMGSDPGFGGWSDVLAVMEELGRVGLPSAVLSAVLANSALGGIDEAQEFLQSIAAGEAIVSWVLPAVEDAVNLRFENGACKGTAECIEHAAVCSHVAILDQGGQLAVFARDNSGVSVTATPSLSDPHWSAIEFEAVTPMLNLALSADKVLELTTLAQLAMAARALGAAQRGFELATDYARERRQFGQPIGRFQAVQHKLANNHIDLTGVHLVLEGAAAAHDAADRNWREIALAAYAFSSPTLRRAALENHHVFGAIGYSCEHEASHQFRRIHSDTLIYGSPMDACESLASFLLDQGERMPDYDLGETGNARREEIRQWLRDNWDANAGISTAEFRKSLGNAGLLTFAWPESFGGSGATPVEEMALLEAIEEAEAPDQAYVGNKIQSHAIMHFGSPEQQAEYLPKLASGDILFCLGYSEPGSGSDLASLRTTAVLDGDEWVINGEKVWTTVATEADYMWLAAKTDPDAEVPHAGISVFIVPMNTPGITVRPSMALYGKPFCHEFLDEVRIPKENLVGELNGGWKVLTAALSTERTIMGGAVSKVRRKFNYLCDAVRSDAALTSNQAVRNRIAVLASELEVSRRLYLEALNIAEQGGVPLVEAALSGVHTSELMQRVGEAALDILGPRAMLNESSVGAVPGDLEQMLRLSIMYVVGGGTNEIQRNLIAQRGLGLPR